MSRNGATTLKVRNLFYHKGLRSDASHLPTSDVSCGVHRHDTGDSRGRKAAIATRLSPHLSPSYCRGMQPQADDRPEDLERRRNALRWVESFAPSHERAVRSRRLTLELLRDSPAPFDRSRYDPGHITASGLVLSPTGERVLLVFHNRLQLWLQPGGHVEPCDNDVLTTAVREVQEETGISVLTGVTPPIPLATASGGVSIRV